MTGFIKLHRKIKNWEWYDDINTTRLFIHLLLSVNYKDKKYKGKTVERGSIITTIPRLSEQTRLTIREIRTAISHLKQTNEIDIKTTNRESLIKVLNYDVYQDQSDDERQADDGQVTCKRQANDLQTTVQRQANDERTEEEGKKVRSKEDKNFLSEQNSDEKKIAAKSKKKSERKFEEDSDEMKLSKLLFDRMRKNNPKCKEPNFQAWCGHIEKMIRIDKRTPKEIQDIILFCQADTFWSTNILSTEKLRKQFDQLEVKRKQPAAALQRADTGTVKSFTEIIKERAGGA